MSKPKKLHQIRYEEKIPTWALPYLVNGDPLDDDADEAIVCKWFEAFEERRSKRGPEAYIIVTPAKDEQEAYFDPFPAFGLACDVEDYLVIINYY
jgi:hypothetical protein